MPFDCRVTGKEIRLTPSSEQSHRIVGQRTEQTVTTCPAPHSGNCRTMMVHHFDMSCSGVSVPWMEVAAAIRGAGSNRAWLEGGRLNVVMPARAVDIPDSCLTPRADDPLQRRVLLTGDCLPWSKTSFEHLVLPAGYAPVGELGARLMMGAAADELVTGSVEGFPLQATSTRPGETTLAKADPDATLEPSGRGGTYYVPVLEPSLGDEWITVVHAGADSPFAPLIAEQPQSRILALFLAIGSALTVALLLVLRMTGSLSMHRFWNARRSAAFDMSTLADGDANLANAASAVAALLERTTVAAAALKGAGPLREVLQAELALVRGRLSRLERQISKGEIAADKSALQFRVLVRELERIHRIVDSAAASLSSGSTRGPARLPRTASEAYEVLGVNSEVSAGVLKKIVDALRMSWHPDHARDEADRRLREDRIRQINIAWDLINGKREAA